MMQMPLADELRKVVRGEVLDDAKNLDAYSRDASLFRVVPQVVVRPLDAADVSAVVKFVAQKKQENHKLDLSITPRAAGTDMSGGPLNTSIILDTTAHLGRLLELGDDYAVVEPGMFFRDFDKETKKKNLELPSYTASRELNTVGGMVGNNSGGEKNLKYGKTARYAQELDVVLHDGQVHTLKNLSGADLAHKLEEPGTEGDIYRQVSSLVSTPAYAKIIEHSKPQVEKNSSGYALWDIGNGKDSLNLARLMVGAQGTLGIVTKIRFGLVHPKKYASMAVIFVNNLSQLGELVPEVLRYKPDSFESYDDHTFSIAIKYLPELAAQMKSGLLGIGLSFLPELWMALTGGIPKLVLLVEFRGDTQEEALAQASKLAQEVARNKSHVSVRVAESEDAARKYWAVRRESFNLLRKKIRGKRTAPFIDDFVVPPLVLPEFLPKLQALMAQYPQLTYTIAGHVGDGNFHIIPLIDPKDPTIGRVIDELSHKVYDLVIEYHGSISGEHNDGLVRTPYVEKMFGREMYGLFMEIKKIFDPHDIFNPGKKVGLTYSQALAKLDLPGSPTA
jgi:FAD/FMN-containing dehydrogenase